MPPDFLPVQQEHQIAGPAPGRCRRGTSLPAASRQVQRGSLVGAAQPAQTRDWVPGLGPLQAAAGWNGHAIVESWGRPAMKLDVARAVVGPVVGRDRILPAKGEHLGSGHGTGGRDPDHALVVALVVNGGKAARCRVLEEAQPAVPVPQPAIVYAVVDRPRHTLFIVWQGLVSPAVNGDGGDRIRQHKAQIRGWSVLSARGQHCICPVLDLYRSAGGVLQAGPDGKGRGSGLQPNRYFRLNAISRAAIAEQHRDALPVAAGSQFPGHFPFVAMLLHRQAPLKAACGNPPPLFRRTPGTGL